MGILGKIDNCVEIDNSKMQTVSLVGYFCVICSVLGQFI